jgi:hypothetical protein
MRTMTMKSESSRTPDPAANAAQPEDLDERARKRMEVGLSPRRPTAKAAVLRPPDVQTLPLPPAVLALILIGVVLVTLLLVAGNLTGRLPTWLPSWTGLAASNPEPTLLAAPNQEYSLRLADDFSQPDSTLRQGTLDGEWTLELLPEQSVYRIEVMPNHLAWSLVGVGNLADYRLQTSVVVDATTPGGFAGLIARFQDDRNFYLFAVDGAGRYQIQQQTGDATVTIQPWSQAPFLNQAGSANVLTIQDDGSLLQFYGNGMLLAEVTADAATGGYVGVAAGAVGEESADVRFDWFQLYERTPSTR